MLLFFSVSAGEDTGESPSNVKRGIELGDVSVSYATSEIDGLDGQPSIKTVTVVRKIAPMQKDDIPSNIIKHPNGATSQYWPADMRNDILQSIKSTPPVFPMETTGYGYYTSYSTKHKQTGPLTFPPAPEQEDRHSGQKVVPKSRTIAKQPTLTKPKSSRHKQWDGQKLASSQENVYQEGPETSENSAIDFSFPTPPQQYYIAATVNPYREYNNFIRDCYHLNPGQYRFSVRPTPELMEIANALSTGDIRTVKFLASRLQEPQQSQLNYTILFPIVPANQREKFPSPTALTQPSVAGGTNNNNNTAPAASTRPSVYIAPTKMRYYRKRLNRRPKPAQRQISVALTTSTTTTEPPQMMMDMMSTEAIQQTTIPTTTDSQWEPMNQPAALPQRRRVVRNRQMWRG